jgi:hypothetical protein
MPTRRGVGIFFERAGGEFLNGAPLWRAAGLTRLRRDSATRTQSIMGRLPAIDAAWAAGTVASGGVVAAAAACGGPDAGALAVGRPSPTTSRGGSPTGYGLPDDRTVVMGSHVTL